MLHVYYTALDGTDAGTTQDKPSFALQNLKLKIAQEVRLSRVYFNL